MATNDAEYIDGLNPNDPVTPDPVSEAAGHLRAIKKSLKQTFPGFTSALNLGIDALDGYESRIEALESGLAIVQQQTMSGRLEITSTGNMSVTGLGFTPTSLLIGANTVQGASAVGAANLSMGVSDGINDYCVSVTADGQSRTGYDKSFYSGTLLWDVYTGGASQAASGTLVSFDADGFTVNETLNLNDIMITWMAFE